MLLRLFTGSSLLEAQKKLKPGIGLFNFMKGEKNAK